MLVLEARSRGFDPHLSDQMSKLVAFESKFDVSAAIQRAINLRNDGFSPIPIIKAIRTEFGMGLKDAKLILHYSMPEEEQKAQEKFIDELCKELERLTDES